VASGVVRFAGRKGGNGIQVLLAHRGGHQTYYNHLSRVARGLRRGARVCLKLVIGYVGSTGFATGPHLDYRVSRNGRFVNPLGEKFLPGRPIASAERTAFMARARSFVERLEREAPWSGAGAARPDELPGSGPVGT
jgi:murein DD-endopeptidase MepM/ murein hydrolase activator NlpD